MCPYAFLICLYVAQRVDDVIYGDIVYVEGGVRCSVTKVREGDKVEEKEEEEKANEKTEKELHVCPHAYMSLSLCLHSCVLMLACACPHACVHVSLCFHMCVLML